ncbi:hypothetical protein ACWEF6_00230 [Amycolatopsis sp. NPDC004772]
MAHPDPDRLTLLALGDPGPDTAHLDTCPACRSDYDSLRTIAGLGREVAAELSLPPVADDVWHRIAAETGQDPAGSPGAAVSAGQDPADWPGAGVSAGRDSVGLPGASVPVGQDSVGLPGASVSAGRDSVGPPGASVPVGQDPADSPGTSVPVGQDPADSPRASVSAGRDSVGPPGASVPVGQDSVGLPGTSVPVGQDPADSPRATVHALPHRGRRTPARRLFRYAAVAVAAVLVAVTLVVTASGGDPGRVVAEVPLSRQAGAPAGAGGQVQVVDDGSGTVRLNVRLTGMPAAEGLYEVWLYDGVKTMVPLGVTAGADLEVAVPPGLSLSRFPVIDVSAQALGQQEHGTSVLRGTVRA